MAMTFDDVARLAASLPGVTLGTRWGNRTSACASRASTPRTPSSRSRRRASSRSPGDARGDHRSLGLGYLQPSARSITSCGGGSRPSKSIGPFASTVSRPRGTQRATRMSTTARARSAASWARSPGPLSPVTTRRILASSKRRASLAIRSRVACAASETSADPSAKKTSGGGGSGQPSRSAKSTPSRHSSGSNGQRTSLTGCAHVGSDIEEPRFAIATGRDGAWHEEAETSNERATRTPSWCAGSGLRLQRRVPVLARRAIGIDVLPSSTLYRGP